MTQTQRNSEPTLPIRLALVAASSLAMAALTPSTAFAGALIAMFPWEPRPNRTWHLSLERHPHVVWSVAVTCSVFAMAILVRSVHTDLGGIAAPISIGVTYLGVLGIAFRVLRKRVSAMSEAERVAAENGPIAAGSTGAAPPTRRERLLGWWTNGILVCCGVVIVALTVMGERESVEVWVLLPALLALVVLGLPLSLIPFTVSMSLGINGNEFITGPWATVFWALCFALSGLVEVWLVRRWFNRRRSMTSSAS